MSKLVDNLGCGGISSKGSMIHFQVAKFSDIIEKIIPFFDKYQIQGVKLNDFEDFCKVAELMKEKKHLTNEGLEQIRVIKSGMNTGRNFNNLHPVSGVTNSLNIFQMQQQKRSFHSKVRSFERIGPHSLDVISLIVGSILGNSYLEKSNTRLGTRVIFVQCNSNVEYLMWFHKFLVAGGYCNPNKPKLTKVIAKNNKILYMYRINSYTFSSFN
jgi:hypothetical protein